MHLASAGVGAIGLIREQNATLPQRSHLPWSAAADAEALATQLRKAGPDTRIVEHQSPFNAHSAEELLVQYDVALDGLSDWQAKLLASDACMRHAKPLIHAGVTGFTFQLFTVCPGKSACLRCAFTQIGMEDPPAATSHSRAFAPLAAMAGALQAGEAIKLIARLGVVQADELIRFDGLRREFSRTQGLFPHPDCPDCGRATAH